jgi:hypothetical protein
MHAPADMVNQMREWVDPQPCSTCGGYGYKMESHPGKLMIAGEETEGLFLHAEPCSECIGGQVPSFLPN